MRLFTPGTESSLQFYFLLNLLGVLNVFGASGHSWHVVSISFRFPPLAAVVMHQSAGRRGPYNQSPATVGRRSLLRQLMAISVFTL